MTKQNEIEIDRLERTIDALQNRLYDAETEREREILEDAIAAYQDALYAIDTTVTSD